MNSSELKTFCQLFLTNPEHTDELGRGTSTFDGTAIAGAAVKHLVQRNKCLSLFATHYHSLLDEWQSEKNVCLGHMQCLVEDESESKDNGEEDGSITFLYTLGPGTCPKSFGINVARLAGLPPEVLSKAKRISSDFEEEMSGTGKIPRSIPSESAAVMRGQILAAVQEGKWEELSIIWHSLQTDSTL